MIDQRLLKFQSELQSELNSILNWWILHMKDPTGGFYGEIGLQNEINKEAPRGLVLTSRILWTFSAAYKHTKNSAYLEIADWAYAEITNHFFDQAHGGYFWAIDASRNPIQIQKQIYGQAFVLYGLVEYADATSHHEPLKRAIDLFELIQDKGVDSEYGGYWEARAHDWSIIADGRLSEKDPNVDKSMNTHLHVLEAYTRLAKFFPDQRVIFALDQLLTLFERSIIDKNTFKQKLYFTADWSTVGHLESFGHDIEASWLLLEASSVTGLEDRKQGITNLIRLMAASTLTAVDSAGGLFYEFDPTQKHLNREKHWWVQAEAMVGFYNAWEISQDDIYINHCLQIWDFIKERICDHKMGEWFWGIDEKSQIMDLPKAGFWKCPYHNVRACIEISNRINKIL